MFPHLHLSIIHDLSKILLNTNKQNTYLFLTQLQVAVFLYNKKITKPASDGCYVNNLAIATPANIEKFHYFLNTRPEPESKLIV